jgi:hypothetical protein
MSPNSLALSEPRYPHPVVPDESSDGPKRAYLRFYNNMVGIPEEPPTRKDLDEEFASTLDVIHSLVADDIITEEDAALLIRRLASAYLGAQSSRYTSLFFAPPLREGRSFARRLIEGWSRWTGG